MSYTGSPLSPLLSNILLHELDKELERQQLKYVRYADDFSIYCRYSAVRGAPRLRNQARPSTRLGVVVFVYKYSDSIPLSANLLTIFSSSS